MCTEHNVWSIISTKYIVHIYHGMFTFTAVFLSTYKKNVRNIRKYKDYKKCLAFDMRLLESEYCHGFKVYFHFLFFNDSPPSKWSVT